MRRTFWAGLGYALGIGTSLYVQKRVRLTVERYTPEKVREDLSSKSREVADRARDAVIDLREAAQEGVDAMRREKADLLAEFSSDPDFHAGPARSLDPPPDRSRGGFRPLRRDDGRLA